MSNNGTGILYTSVPRSGDKSYTLEQFYTCNPAIHMISTGPLH